MLRLLQAPAAEPSWKDRPATGTDEIFFLTTLDRAPAFVATVMAMGEERPEPVTGIGVYLQPIHQGAGLHCELILPFDRPDPASEAAVHALASQAAIALFRQGAYFSRPYGEWADLVFDADPPTARLARTVKAIFDPNNVMNPGKLCFPRGDA
jgi:FAD/FMN-containing dehydrogenase